QLGRWACTQGRVAKVACTTSTIVMPKKRNASKHGKCSVRPDSKPAAPISGDDAAREVMSPPWCGFLVAGCDLFVVLLFDVHRPDVVVGAEDVLDREHRREHRVVLVVV